MIFCDLKELKYQYFFLYFLGDLHFSLLFLTSF